MKTCSKCKSPIDLENDGFSCSGNIYSHSPDCPPPIQPSGAGFIAVGKILNDLRDRRGLRQAWDDLHPDIQADIKHEWAFLITDVLDMQAKVIKHQLSESKVQEGK